MNQNIIARMARAVLMTAALAALPMLHASTLDTSIENAFKDSFVYRNYLQEESVTAKSTEGVVTLTGSVSVESHKALAEDTAANLPGVVRVDNQLQTEDEMDAEKVDNWIARRVKVALFFRRNVSAGNTEVNVKDGVVTLSGEVADEAQKDLTAEYVKDIRGVVSVVNNLEVVDAAELAERTDDEKIDDASVTAQVRAAMAIHRSTRDIPLVITTRDGKVTLTGIANSAAEKTLVTKMASDIHGVDSVNNEMTVKTV